MIPLLPSDAREFYLKADKNYEAFWEEAADTASCDIRWFKKWSRVFEWEYPMFLWYIGGVTNISYNCLDYKLEKGMGGKTAFIAESGDTGERRTITYAELLGLVKRYSASLRSIGVGKGDRVAIYMPMSIEAGAMMLACARIGAIHMVIFAGFSSAAIADRLELSGAEYIITQARGIRRNKPIYLKEMIDEALNRHNSPEMVKKVIVFNHALEQDIPMKKGRDVLWSDFLTMGEGKNADYIPMESNEPLFILPTSGTTAKPKLTLQKHGGYQVYCYSMGKWIYGLNTGDIWFCTSDIGWIVGHSYNIYTPLLVGCTSILYDGVPDYPRLDMWWDIIDRNKVTGMFTSPTGVRGLMRNGIDQAKKHDLQTLKRIFCAGEVLNPAAWEWLHNDVFEGRIPVIDHMWQTETSGPIVGNPFGLGLAPIKPGSAGFAVPGVITDIVDEKDGHPLPPGEKGVLVIKKPFPGLTSTLWGDSKRYLNDYWEAKAGTKGLYYAGDAAYHDGDGYIWFMGRADEVIKIAAHRIGTIEIENALLSHPAVVEAGVSGVPDPLKGEVASAFVVLGNGYKPGDDLKKELMQYVRKEMGSIVVIKDILFVNMLPKTRSGKIMRRVMKSLLSGKESGDLSTIEEEASVDEIKEAVQRMKAGST